MLKRIIPTSLIPMRIFLLCLLCLFSPVVTQAQTEGGGPTGPIATQNTDQQDAQIAERLRDILAQLGGYEDVTITVGEGIVTARGTTALASEAERITALAARIEGVVAIENQVAETTDISERLNPAMERFQARLTQIITFLPLLLIAAGVFGVIVFVGYLLSSWRKPWDRLAPNRFIADLYRQMVQIAFVIGGLVIALDVLDATALLSTILGAAGIIGLAFGFAVRDTVENYIASIMLSIRQPFRPNDAVEINGDEGKVIRLTSRATILLSFDGNHIRIPNATVFKSRIVNFSQNDARRFKFVLAIDWAADIAAARALAEHTVQALPFVMDEPPASVWIDEITDSGITLKVTGWINQHDTSIVRAKGEALRQVKMALEAQGITLPDTTYTVNLQRSGTSPAVGSTAQIELNPAPNPQIDQVDPSHDTALERIIEAERHDPAAEDLLNADAPPE